jgi:peptidoglycan/xylan/chitin deacetylase (PgdA/CDA1 family)
MDRMRIGKRLWCALAASMVFGAASAGTFEWPHGARAAVSLAYDDALDSQLDNALPALDKYRLKASFYLQLSNPSVSARLEHWRAAAQRGHELGNHTLFHQCSHSQPGRDWVQQHRDLDTTSVAQMKDQIMLANVMLHAIDGRRERTFTAPCGDLLARGEDYVTAIASQFVALKVGQSDVVAGAMSQIDPAAVKGLVPVELTGQQLIDMVKAAAANGTMVSFTFHGIGGDYLSISSDAHEALLKFLAENSQMVWTDTFINIMKHVKAQRAGAERTKE